MSDPSVQAFFVALLQVLNSNARLCIRDMGPKMEHLRKSELGTPKKKHSENGPHPLKGLFGLASTQGNHTAPGFGPLIFRDSTLSQAWSMRRRESGGAVAADFF